MQIEWAFLPGATKDLGAKTGSGGCHSGVFSLRVVSINSHYHIFTDFSIDLLSRFGEALGVGQSSGSHQIVYFIGFIGDRL